MATYLSPIGLSTTALVANQVSLLATFKERVCRSYCAHGALLPTASVSYTYGAPTLSNTTVFVPITAKITVVVPNGCGCTATQVFTEVFYAAFQGQTALPTSVTIASAGTIVGNSSACGKTKVVTVEDSLVVTLV